MVVVRAYLSPAGHEYTTLASFAYAHKLPEASKVPPGSSDTPPNSHLGIRLMKKVGEGIEAGRSCAIVTLPSRRRSRSKGLIME